MLDDGVSGLIGRIYDGVHDAGAWDEAMDGLLERTRSRCVLISAVDLKRERYSSATFHGPDEARFLDGVREYKTDLYRTDPTLAYGIRNPQAGFVSLSMVVDRSDYRDHPYVRWCRSTLGTGHCVIRYTEPQDDLIFGVSLHAPTVREAHDIGELRLFLALFEHMERALRLAARPPDFEGGDARLLIDRRGRVRAVSDAAGHVVGCGDGLSLVQGRLLGARLRDTARLDAAIRSALGAVSDGSAGGAVALPRPSGKRDWLLTITPLPNPPSPFEAFRPSAMVRIVDQDAIALADPAAHWVRLFSFTPAENKLATALLGGEGNLREAAETIGIAYATARVQLASLFEKTGTHSQAQLARLLTRLEA